MPLGWQDRVVARVAGRCLGTAVNPSFQIIEGIDDPTAELPVGRPRAIGSVLFQGSSGQTEKACCFRRAQVSRRQAGVRVRPLRDSVVVWRANELDRASRETMAE